MTIRKHLLIGALIVIIVSFVAIPWGSARVAEPGTGGERALVGRYPAIKAGLEKNQFGIPIYLESKEEAGSSQVEIYSILDYPFAIVRDSLQSPANWCDINSLLINVKACTCRRIDSQWLLSLYSGRKYYQPPRDAFKLDFRFQVAAQREGYLCIALSAKDGPFFTRDYRIKLEAAPLDGTRTLVHFSYAFSYGKMARMAINSYFATIGRDKKGFTVIATGKYGEPVYQGGIRGAVERNAVRYYLALETYMDTLKFHGEQGFEKRISRWYDLTGRFPRQLYEIDKGEYLANKRREHQNQLLLQKEAG
ncbi:MAG TPA: hypothetical protein VFG19_01335 [Geobacteraceae bacterium]|nr:hypothetical protein [Geobacteraceae bacterium]